MAGKRKQHLGEGAASVLTAADAVEAASGVRRRAPVKLVHTEEARAPQAQPEPMAVTNIRIPRRHMHLIQLEALRRSQEGGGRADQSAIYREAVKEWLEKRGLG